MCFLNNILLLELFEIIATIPKSATTVNDNGSKKNTFFWDRPLLAVANPLNKFKGPKIKYVNI